MKTFFKFQILILVVTIFLGCNSSGKTQKKADIEINAIQQLISKNSYNLARIKIDSFHVNFRMLVDKRRLVASLEDTITLRESYRTIQYFDSVQPKLIHQFDSLSKSFKFEKDTIFQEIGNYVHKQHITEQNINRNYLKAKIDENGEIRIFSNIKGMKIAHRSFRVSSGIFFAETDTINRTNFSEHGYTDGESYFESVIFGGESIGSIVKFIYDNQNSKIKVSLKGNQEFSYFLNPKDIYAIAQSYHFWILKRDIVKLERQLNNSNNQIKRIKSIKINKNFN